MDSNSTMYPANQSSYTVIRPVDDLWMWWALASVVAFLLGQIPSSMFGASYIETTLIFTFIASSFLLIWVLNRYLGRFSWKQWLVTNISGFLVAFIAAIAVLEISLLYNGVFDASFHLAMHIPFAKNTTFALFSVVWIYANVIPVCAMIIAFAQWQVLKHYTAENGAGLWVLANIISFLTTVSSYFVAKGITTSIYVQVAIGTVVTIVTSLMVGYILMRLLQGNAPGSATMR